MTFDMVGVMNTAGRFRRHPLICVAIVGPVRASIILANSSVLGAARNTYLADVVRRSLIERCAVNERNTKGWRIPREGTRSHQIYQLMLAGNGPSVIQRTIGGSGGSIRVLMHKIRHAPEPYRNGMPTGRPRYDTPRRPITLPQLKCLMSPPE